MNPLGAMRAAIAAAQASPTARNSARSLAATLGGLALSFLVSIELSRALGVNGYGVYTYAFGWANVLLVLAKLQFDDSAIRYVSAYTATEDWALLRGFLGFGARFVIAASLTVALLYAAITALGKHESSVRWALWAVAANLPLLSIAQFRAATLQGLKRVWEAQYPTLLLRPVVFGAAIALTWLLSHGHLTPVAAVMLNNGSLLVTLLVSSLLVRRLLPPPLRLATPRTRRSEWTRASFGFVSLAIAQTVLGAQADIVIIGMLLTKEDVARYSVAVQLAMLAAVGVTAMMFVLIPQISSLHAKGHHEELDRLVGRAASAGVLLSVPVVLALVVLGPVLLSLYGHEYVQAQPVLLVLAAGQAIVASVGILAGYLMTMTGRQTPAAVIVAGSAALYLVLSFVLTPRLGTVGTALATSTAQIVRTVVLGVYLYRTAGIRILPRWRRAAAA